MSKKKSPDGLYIWNGINWLHGVPARDLTIDEWNGLTDEQRRILGPAYTPPAPPELPKPTTSKRSKSESDDGDSVVEEPTEQES